jgi:hypothetical protein
MVRKGFFIGKRILSAFARYARLASHEEAVEKDSYRSLRSIVSLQRTKAWNSGRMEQWIDGFKTQYSNFLIFQHPTP